MEVVGAIASFIAIAQASQAGLKALRALRSISDIQQEWCALLEELHILRALAEESQNSAKEVEQGRVEALLLSQTQKTLTEVADTLERLSLEATRSSRGSPESKAKTTLKRHKSLQLKSEILRLRQKAVDARNALTLAIILLNKQELQQQATAIRRVENSTALISLRVDAGVTSIKSLHATAAALVKNHSRVGEVSDDTFGDIQGSDTSSTTLVPINNHSSPELTSLPLLGSSVQSGPLVALPGVCPAGCPCYCHLGRNVYHSPRLVKLVFGSLTLAWRKDNSQSETPCSDPSCQRQQRSSFSVHWHLPPWVGTYLLTLSSNGPGSFSWDACLRPIGTIPPIHDIWVDLKQARTSSFNQHFLRQAQNFRPHDVESGGRTLIEFFIQDENIVELLLALWGNILPKEGLPPGAFFAAQLELRSEKVRKSEHHQHVLRKVISYSSDADDFRRTQLHEAIAEGGDIDHILRHDAADINVLDPTGAAPIHIAIESRNISALSSLIRAGADLEIKLRGRSPLTSAVQSGSFECAAQLVAAKCNVNPINSRSTPLGSAMESSAPDSVDTVQLLLNAGARTDLQDSWGMSPAHLIASCKLSYEKIKEKLSLMVRGGADVDEADPEGWTPLTFCLRMDNLPAIRCLYELGVSWDFRTSNQSSSLLFATNFCSLETMNYLASIGIDEVDHRALIENRGDCWMLFIKHVHDPTAGARGQIEVSDEWVRVSAELYRDVRDRCLQREIRLLEEARRQMKRRDERNIPALEELTEWFGKWRLTSEETTYKTIRLQVDQDSWGAASESVEERIEVLKEEIATSPWARPHMLWDTEDMSFNPYGFAGTDEELAKKRASARSLRERFLREWDEKNVGWRDGEAGVDSGWETTDDEAEDM